MTATIKATSTASSNVTTSLVYTLPTWTAGDLVMFQVSLPVISTTSTASVSAGWTPLTGTPITVSDDIGGGTWWRVMQSGDINPTVTLTVGKKMSIAGFSIDAGSFNPAAPISVLGTAGIRGNVTSTSLVAGAFTPGATELCIGLFNEKSSTATTATPPSGMTAVVSQFGSGGAEPSASIFSVVAGASPTAFTAPQRTTVYDVGSGAGWAEIISISNALTNTPKSASDTLSISVADSSSIQKTNFVTTTDTLSISATEGVSNIQATSSTSGIIRSSTSFVNTGSNSNTYILPTWQADDFVYIAVNISNTDYNLTAPAGWTPLAGAPNATPVGSQTCGVWWRKMVSGDGNPTFSIDSVNPRKFATTIVVIDGNSVDGSGAIAATGVVGIRPQNPNSTDLIAGAITTNQDNQKVVGFFMERASTSTTVTPPSGSSVVVQQFGTGGGATSSTITQATYPTSGTVLSASQRTATYDFASGTGYALMIAFASPVAAIQVAGNDTLSVNITESRSFGTVAVSASDTISTHITDVSSFGTLGLTASDTLSVATTETATVAIPIFATDSLRVAVTETANHAVSSAAVWNDIGTEWNDTVVDWSGLGLSTFLLNTSDTLSIALTDTSQFGVVAVSASDTLRIHADDIATFGQIAISTSDTLAISANDVSNVFVPIVASDTLSVSVVDASGNIAGTAVVINAADTLAINVLDLSTQPIVRIAKTDTLSIRITESSNRQSFTSLPVYAWDGSNWVSGDLTIWNGTTWATKPVYQWTGSDWVAL